MMTGAAKRWSTGMSKKPRICAAGRSMVRTRALAAWRSPPTRGEWLGRKDSNLRSGVQSPAPYHLATPQRGLLALGALLRPGRLAPRRLRRRHRGGHRGGGGRARARRDLLAVDAQDLLLPV